MRKRNKTDNDYSLKQNQFLLFVETNNNSLKYFAFLSIIYIRNTYKTLM